MLLATGMDTVSLLESIFKRQPKEFVRRFRRLKRLRKKKYFRTSRDEVETGFSNAGAMNAVNGNAQRAQRI
jgi:hypothetical protein